MFHEAPACSAQTEALFVAPSLKKQHEAGDCGAHCGDPFYSVSCYTVCIYLFFMSYGSS